MCLFLHKFHPDPDPDIYLFPALEWDALASEYVVSKRKLSYPAALSAMKNLLKFAGLDPKLYALHSPRIGAANNTFRSKVPLHIIDAKGRWKSKNSKYSYLRVQDRYVCRTGSDYRY
jgi:hypothetical protein